MNKTFYKITICGTLSLLLNISVKAQGVTVTTDLQDVRFVGNIYPPVQGSPYLYELWVRGSVILNDGSKITDIYLQYDQIKDEIHFKGNDKSVKNFEHPVSEFTLNYADDGIETRRTFRNGFTIEDKDANSNSYYEILADGKVKFIKRISKKIIEARGGNSIIVNKQIQENTKYYIGKDNTFTKIKKDKKSIFGFLKDKESELNQYITTNTLNLKSDSDFARLINYYNTL